MSHNTLVHRGLRQPIRALALSPITPDALTALRLLTGLAAAICFALPGRLLGAGCVLAFLSALLDRADGELARQTGRFSRIGPQFDLVSDCAATIAIFIGLGAGLGVPFGLPAWSGSALGVSGAVSVVSIFMLVNGVQLDATKTGGLESRSRLFDPDDIMLILPLIVWFGGGPWIVLLSGLVTPLVAISVAFFRMGRRTPRIPALAGPLHESSGCPNP